MRAEAWYGTPFLPYPLDDQYEVTKHKAAETASGGGPAEKKKEFTSYSGNRSSTAAWQGEFYVPPAGCPERGPGPLETDTAD